MKILFAIKSMDHYVGGAERVLAQIAGELTRQGHDIALLTFDRPGGEPVYPLAHGIRRIALGIGDITKPATLAETWQRIGMLRQAVTREQPQAVIGFMHGMFVPLSLALIGTGIPLIASEHIVPAHYRSRPLQYALMTISHLLIRATTVPSANVKQLYPRLLQRAMIVIPNPVYKPVRLADPGHENALPKIILSVGRLEAQKNQRLLIDAFARIAGRFPDWHIRLIGEGSRRAELERRIRQANLQGRIHLPGTTRQIEKEYESAHIFALPSVYESFGLATAEALMHGLPAVGLSECPGTNELICDGHNGYLAQNSPDDFAAALARLMESADLRRKLGDQARTSLAALSPESVSWQWIHLLKQVSAK